MATSAHATATPTAPADAPGLPLNACPMCEKAVMFVRDVRYCSRCRIAGIGVDGKDDDPLTNAAPKLKAAADAYAKELEAAGHPAPVLAPLSDVPNAPAAQESGSGNASKTKH